MPEGVEQSKSKRGGKRAGAGRKPSTFSGVARRLGKIESDSAALILAAANANQKWRELLDSDDEYIQIKALMYLTDRAHGKAKEKHEVEGGLNFTFERIGLSGPKS